MSLVGQWRKWIRPLVLTVYGMLLIIALPLMIVEFQLHDTASHLQAWFIGGLFVILAVPISLWGILQHLIHYNQPNIQKYIVRILWMVPIYAINAANVRQYDVISCFALFLPTRTLMAPLELSPCFLCQWLALRFKQLTIYLDTARECYEAYVIYNFMSYLLVFLHQQYPHVEDVIAVKPQTKHLFPFCLLYSWTMGTELISRCKHGVLQYTVIRTLTTVIALICELSGAYSEGEFSLKAAWLYLVIINNISQIWAMYCLILFYKATKEQLAPIKPVAKFMCVKAVVFLSFWQAVLIAVLVKLDVIQAIDTWVFNNVKDVANGLQDFCICIEMFVAAIAHYYSFSHKPYVDDAAGNADCWPAFKTMLDVSDVHADVVDHIQHVSKRASDYVHPQRVRGTASTQREETTPLLRESISSRGRLTSEETDAFEVLLNDDRQLGSAPSQQLGLAPSQQMSVVADLISVNAFESSSESFLQKSTTASMNNYVQFSTSIDTTGVDILCDVGCTSAGRDGVVAGVDCDGDVGPDSDTNISNIICGVDDVAAGDAATPVINPNIADLATGHEG